MKPTSKSLLIGAFLLQVPAQLIAEPLSRLAADHRETGRAPAIGAVVVRCTGPMNLTVSGVARSDGSEQLGSDARFNIGSNAKSMLASLAATYVQEGKLSWNTSVGDVLAKDVANLDPRLAKATLAQLLSHRSGLPAFATGTELRSVNVPPGSPSAQRLVFARQVLTREPAYLAGSKSLYSNAGYVVAGVMLERIGGRPFESLMKERLFRPLQMRATFGSPVPPESGQPWGHYTAGAEQKPYEDRDPIIPPFLQPAGDVSLTMENYGRYLREHLCGLQGRRTRLLKPGIVRQLHASTGDDGVGMGWGKYDLGGTPSSVHVGGTGAFSAFVAVQPGRGQAAATVTNSGAPAASAAALALLHKLAGSAPD
jgi:CubicO group peptidase (beta-lactamase class C family)